MAAVRAVGGDLGAAGWRWPKWQGLPGAGRGTKMPCGAATALLIDESYNANPASMRATLASAGRDPAAGASRCWAR
jgi:UDP-N-acetylmuramoyl-tripeptide--D-alanyl-D-alanine ligase